MSSLDELVALIAGATETVKEEYAKRGHPVPDLNSAEPHPYDAESSSDALRRAIQVLEGACAQLCATAARPGHTLVNRSMQCYEEVCIYVAAETKVADHLQGAPNGMHVTELAAKVNIEASKLARVLRLLATKHCFREVLPNVFANNRLSATLLSDNPLASLYAHHGDEVLKSAGNLYETLVDSKSGPSFAVQDSAFVRTHGTPMFEYFHKNASPKPGERFVRGLIGWGATVDAATLNFPWQDLPPGTTVCDVGGGVGNITLQLALAFPQLWLTLQDTPAVLAQAQAVCSARAPAAVEEQRITFKPLDFFTESPVPGCDIYYLKHIIHDWPDAENVTILRNIKRAMTATSCILIDEYILQPACADTGTHAAAPAPAPLLANFGAGRIRPYNLDLQMLNNLNSRERTRAEFAQLAADAGLRFVKVWELGETGMVELRK